MPRGWSVGGHGWKSSDEDKGRWRPAERDATGRGIEAYGAAAIVVVSVPV